MVEPTTTIEPHTLPAPPVAAGTVDVEVAQRRVARLAEAAAEAATVRGLMTHPDVIALRVERVRTQVDALLWAGIVLGLAFTMVNVQTFAATGAQPWSLGWWVAWLLDPMVSLVLLAVLRAEQVTARYQVPLPVWGRRTKWLTFAATYVMNTWTSWGFAEQPFTAAGVVLHSVPPLVVFATAETGPGLRDRLTEAVARALIESTGRHSRTDSTVHDVAAESVREPVAEPVRELDGVSVREPAGPSPRRQSTRQSTRRAGRSRKPARRSLAEYLHTARTELAAAREGRVEVDPSPAWCRRVTGCSAGTSVKLAAVLRSMDFQDVDPDEITEPAEPADVTVESVRAA